MGEERNEYPYRNISLRRELVNQIEEYIKVDKRYSSITDFIVEAIRLRLEELVKLREVS